MVDRVVRDAVSLLDRAPQLWPKLHVEFDRFCECLDLDAIDAAWLWRAYGEWIEDVLLSAVRIVPGAAAEGGVR